MTATEQTPLLVHENVDQNEYDEDANRAKMFREELWTLTRFSLPVCGTQLLEYSLVISSVLSIGHLGTTELAAITLGSMTANVSGLTVIQGLTNALDTLLPSAWTSPQPQLIGLWSQRMAVVVTAGLIPMLIIWLNAETILLSLKQDPDVARLAATYLRWMALGLPAYGFNAISRRYFQSQGLFTIPTRIIFVVAPINALLNYLLVWGPAPFRLGFIGAPIATAISFNLVSIFSLCYGVFFVPHTAWHPITRRSFTSLGLLLRLGLAGVAQTSFEWWAWELVALVASLISPIALATQSVLLVSSSTTFQAPYAMGLAVSVRIGNLLGQKRAFRASISCKASIFLSVIFAILASTMFLVFRDSWGYLFSDDPQVVNLVASILPLLALFQVFDGNAAVAGGILRAMGRQFTGAALNFTAYYVLGVPLGIYLAFSSNLGLHGLWTGLTLALIFESVCASWLCLRTDWSKEVEKVWDRLDAEQQTAKKIAEEVAEEVGEV